MSFIEYLKDVDESIFRWVLDNLNSDWIVKTCDFIVQEENLFPVMIIFFIFYAWKQKKKAAIFFLLVLFLLLFSEPTVSFLKSIFERPRPYTVFGINVNPGSFSFPSAHAFNTMSQAVLWATWFRRQKNLFFAISITIGVARFLSHYHFAGDIMAGWILGWAFGSAYVYILKVINKRYNWIDFPQNRTENQAIEQ